ncbi:GNAT family N-acetyltransferase [Candidatus Woesearchaeota archaeon]|nr:GNAT family N-acetyltransferase [Candidatus Woesearchaeota archaeon]
MNFRVEQNLTKCKLLWDNYTPNLLLWHDWDVISSFYDSKRYDPYFLILEDDSKKDIGLLPLWFNQEKKSYRFFGEGYQENNVFWFDLNYFQEVFEKFPLPLTLHDLNGKCVEAITQKYPNLKDFFKQIDFRYFIDCQKTSSLEIYLNSFNKKHRKNLLYDLRNLEKLNYTVNQGNLENFNEFVKFNVARFGEESDFNDPIFAGDVLNFFNVLDLKKLLYPITVLIDGKVEAVEFCAFHNNIFYVLNGGYNLTYRNLGKLLILETIKKGFELGAIQIDFLTGDAKCWKNLWNFESEAYYTFKKEN